MASMEVQARHVFHAPTAGWDRIHAWQEATGEPAFVWGRDSGHTRGRFFSSIKRDFALWLEATESAPITIYHDGAGVDALGAMDANDHKILFLHQFFPRWERLFEWNIRMTGRLMVGHASQSVQVRERFGWIPERFILPVPQPLLKPEEQQSSGGGAGNRTGIWLHGLPWRRFGNRLRSIIDRWSPEAGQLEIVVSGKGRPSWARKDHVVWSAELPFQFALYRLHTWDSTLLLNDYSLDAPWLMAALEMGCFPLVPEGDGASRVGGWEDDSAPSPYPWGDIPAAIGLLQEWRKAREQLQSDFEAWSSNILGTNRNGPEFLSLWQEAKQTLMDQRPPKLRSRKPVGGWHPVRWYERIQRLRAGN
ncbi:MAG: hypothetical protein AB3N33_06125 [Puniceicoccaceae bacterium]